MTIEEWLRKAGSTVTRQLRDLASGAKSELSEVGTEMRLVTREAKSALSAVGRDAVSGLRHVAEASGEVVSDAVHYSVDTMAESALSVPGVIGNTVGTAKGVVGTVASKGWDALDSLDDFITKVLVDAPESTDGQFPPDKVLEFEVRVMKRPGDKIGVGVKWLEHENGPVAITQVKQGMLLDRWNRDLAKGHEVVRPGDFLVSANGVSLVNCAEDEKRRLLTQALATDPTCTKEVVLGITRVTTSSGENYDYLG